MPPTLWRRPAVDVLSLRPFPHRLGEEPVEAAATAPRPEAPLDEGNHVRAREVVQDPEAQHDVETPVRLGADIANVVLHEVDVRQTEDVLGVGRLGDVALTGLDTDDRAALPGELDREAAFV